MSSCSRAGSPDSPASADRGGRGRTATTDDAARSDEPRRLRRSSSPSCRTRGSAASSRPSRTVHSRRHALARGAARRARGDTLTLEFSAGAEFHRSQVEEAKNVSLLRDALYEVTGRKLTIATALADAPREPDDDDQPVTEDEFISLFKDTLDAGRESEVEEGTGTVSGMD